MHTKYESKFGKVILEIFKLKKQDLPVAILVKQVNSIPDDVAKYLLPPGTLFTEKNVDKFFQDFKENKLKRFIFSEKLEKSHKNENGVLELVGFNFEEQVFDDAGTDVLLHICGTHKTCLKFNEVFQRVAKKLSKNSKLKIAQINNSYNEVSLVEFKALPSVVLIPGHKERGERIKNIKFYNGSLTTEKIVNWVKDNVQNPLENSEELENEDVINQKEKKDRVIAKASYLIDDYKGTDKEISSGFRRTFSFNFDSYPEDEDQDFDINTDNDDNYSEYGGDLAEEDMNSYFDAASEQAKTDL